MTVLIRAGRDQGASSCGALAVRTMPCLPQASVTCVLGPQRGTARAWPRALLGCGELAMAVFLLSSATTYATLERSIVGIGTSMWFWLAPTPTVGATSALTFRGRACLGGSGESLPSDREGVGSCR